MLLFSTCRDENGQMDAALN